MATAQQTTLLPIVFKDMQERARACTPNDNNPAKGNNDPFFKAVRDQLAVMKLVSENLDHLEGKFPSQSATTVTALSAEEKTLAAVYGILERDNMTKPEVDRFGEAVVKALSEYSSEDNDRKLFDAVLDILAKAGETTSGTATEQHVRTNWWAAIVRTIKGKVKYDDPHLDEIVVGALIDLRNAGGAATPSVIDIDLPDLEKQADVEIVADNLKAMQAIYFAAMLEELKVFQVMDKLVELFHCGMLPLGRGVAGDGLYRYWKDGNVRLSEMERRNLYARTFGFPGGEATMESPNREFNELWLRFVSAVSSYMRKIELEGIYGTTTAATISQEQMRKKGCDLAANLSLHGYGIAYFVATELQIQLNEIINLLSNPEIKSAYGARDMFQVIDQVATLELGGAKNSIRYRAMADSGAVIIRWLANNGSRLMSSYGNVLDLTQKGNSKTPKINPTDYDLVNGCEQWLAVTGTPDARVIEYAQPYEPPMMTSRPIQIPSIAKEMLESVGVQEYAPHYEPRTLTSRPIQPSSTVKDVLRPPGVQEHAQPYKPPVMTSPSIQTPSIVNVRR